MREQEHRSFPPSLVEGITALVSAVLAQTVLTLLPLVERLEPGVLGGSLPPGGYAFRGVAVVILLQAMALLWTKTAPRTVLFVVVSLPVTLAAFAPGPAFSLSTIAVLCAIFLAVGVLPLHRAAPVLTLAVLLVAGPQNGPSARNGSWTRGRQGFL